MNYEPRRSDVPMESDEQLDGLLNQWSSRQTDLLDGESELRARIVSQLAEEDSAGDGTGPGLSVDSPPRSSGWLLVGIAAVVLVVFAWSIRWQAGDLPLAVNKDAPPVAYAPPAADAAEKALLLDEMEKLFGGSLCWVAETSDDVHLGMCHGSTLVDTRHAPLSVRLTVVQRAAGQQQWSPVWSMDVTTRSQHVVRTGPSSTDVSLWVYRMPDGMLAVDADLSLSGPVSLETSFSGIQKSGVPSEIHKQKIDDTEYAVFQTILSLDDADDVS